MGLHSAGETACNNPGPRVDVRLSRVADSDFLTLECVTKFQIQVII